MSNPDEIAVRKKDLTSELFKIRKEREALMEAEHKVMFKKEKEALMDAEHEVMFKLDLLQSRDSIDDDEASDAGASYAASALTEYPPCPKCRNYCKCPQCPCCVEQKAGAACVCDFKHGQRCGCDKICTFCGGGDNEVSDAGSALAEYPPCPKCPECGNYCECIECICCVHHKAGAVCVCDPKRGRSRGCGCSFCRAVCFESDSDH